MLAIHPRPMILSGLSDRCLASAKFPAEGMSVAIAILLGEPSN